MQSLAMSVTALLFSKVGQPAQWNSATLDQIVLFGNHLLKTWRCGPLQPLKLINLPERFQFAQLDITMKVVPFISDTPVEDRGKGSGLFEHLDQALRTHTRLILQVDKMHHALWIKNGMFYLFDPYPRDDKGNVCLDRDGQCCIHMISFLQKLSRLFRQNMRQLLPEAKIYIHAVIIERLERAGIEARSSLEVTSGGEEHFEQASIETTVQYDMPKSKTPEVLEEDQVLVLNSPSPSITSFDDEVCRVQKRLSPVQVTIQEHDQAVDDKDLSKLTLMLENTRLRAGTVHGRSDLRSPTPSVEYLCMFMAKQLAGEAIGQIQEPEEVDPDCKKITQGRKNDN